jgi:hypothetical protein
LDRFGGSILLGHVGQLVSDQGVSHDSAGAVFPGTERHVLADGESAGVEAVGESGGVGVRVHPDMAEAAAEG